MGPCRRRFNSTLKSRTPSCNLGLLLRAARQFDEAMEKADLVLAKAPENADALLLKGSLLLAKNDVDACIPFLKGLPADAADRPEVYLMLASAHARNKNTAAPRRPWRKALPPTLKTFRSTWGWPSSTSRPSGRTMPNRRC